MLNYRDADAAQSVGHRHGSRLQTLPIKDLDIACNLHEDDAQICYGYPRAKFDS